MDHLHRNVIRVEFNDPPPCVDATPFVPDDGNVLETDVQYLVWINHKEYLLDKTYFTLIFADDKEQDLPGGDGVQ